VLQARYALRDGSKMDGDSLSVQFKVPRFVVYRVICNILERDGRLTEALECFRQMQNELPEDASVHDEQAEWELGGWFQPQTRIALGILTVSIRLQSTVYEGIRTKRRCRHGLCIIRGRCCPLFYSTEPRSSIGRPLDKAKQSTSWEWIMGRFLAGCQRSTCILIHTGISDQHDPRQSNSIHHFYLATKAGMQHCLALTATMKQIMRITICS